MEEALEYVGLELFHKADKASYKKWTAQDWPDEQEDDGKPEDGE